MGVPAAGSERRAASVEAGCSAGPPDGAQFYSSADGAHSRSSADGAHSRSPADGAHSRSSADGAHSRSCAQAVSTSALSPTPAAAAAAASSASRWTLLYFCYCDLSAGGAREQLGDLGRVAPTHRIAKPQLRDGNCGFKPQKYDQYALEKFISHRHTRTARSFYLRIDFM